MDMNTAIENILRNYGELAAVDRPQLENILLEIQTGKINL